MSDRLNTILKLPSGLYLKGCPIIIAAGALYTVSDSGKALVQLKLKNISDKAIASCKVTVKAYENNGNLLQGVEDFSYLDLDSAPGEEFGSKMPIILPDSTTRNFDASVTEIVFSDGTVESYEYNEWEAIPDHRPLSEVLDNQELIKQYRLEVGEDSRFVPEKRGGLFLCTCGGINLSTNNRCCDCGKDYNTQIEQLDSSVLFEKAENRINEEIIKENEAKDRKVKKRKLIIMACIVMLVVGIALIMMRTVNSKSLPTGVHFGDSKEEICEVANSLGSNSRPEDHEIKAITKVYGYNAEVTYIFEKDLLDEVRVHVKKSGRQVSNDVINQLTRTYGKPTSELDDREYTWEKSDMEIHVKCQESNWSQVTDGTTRVYFSKK